MERALPAQQVKHLVHPDKIQVFEMLCCAPSKACSWQIENERMPSRHKKSHFSRIRFFFPLPLYGNAGMINNQHISVAAFVPYSLNLLSCHLFILNLRRNKYRNR